MLTVGKGERSPADLGVRLTDTISGPDAADIVGHDEPGRPWLASVAIGLAVSIIGHAVLIGSGIVRFEWTGTHDPNADAIPIELVPDPSAKKAPIPQASPIAPPPPSSPGQPAPPKPPQPQAKTAVTSSSTPGEAPPSPVPAPAGANVAIDTTMTKDELEALRAQVQSCWTIPPGWTDSKQVSVTIDFRMNRDGTVAGNPTLIEFPASPYGKVAAQNALRAVLRCGPYHLPVEKYGDWHEVQIRLTPAG